MPVIPEERGAGASRSMSDGVLTARSEAPHRSKSGVALEDDGRRRCCLYHRVFSNISRPMSMRRISEVPAPIS